MQIVQYSRFGQPEDVLEVQQMAVPQPGAGEVRIRMEAAPVHLADLKHIRGLPWFDQYIPPYTPGYEGVGRISALGPEVTRAILGSACFYRSALVRGRRN